MLVIKAISFAATKHKGQERKGSGLPYVIHPIIVMELIQKYKGNSKDIEALKCAAILHDVLEDTDCDSKELEREFGPLVASLVMELTSDKIMIKKFGKKEYIKNKMINMSKYAFILKLLDRFSNIIDEPRTKYVYDTIETLDFIKTNRADITERQSLIILDIENACKKILDTKK